MNAQEKIEFKELGHKVDRILFYFESDNDTKHIGLVEQVDLNTKNIAEIQTENKVRVGKVGVVLSIISLILGVVGGFVAKYFLK